MKKSVQAVVRRKISIVGAVDLNFKIYRVGFQHLKNEGPAERTYEFVYRGDRVRINTFQRISLRESSQKRRDTYFLPVNTIGEAH